MNKPLLYLSTAIFLGTLGLAWVTHGTGVVADDPDRSIAVPNQLTVALQVQAAHNGRDIFFRYRWPAERPGIFHDVVRYENGSWVRAGDAVPGSQPEGLHEDRVAMMVDDGSVPEFARYGGYITIGDGIEGFTEHASGEAVEAHPYLGGTMGQEEITKYLPATRQSLGDWADMTPERDLATLREAGYFLDLWHWRGHRSNPIGLADDQLVAEARLSDEGRAAAGTNWDGDLGQPLLMFDEAATGYRALKWTDVVEGRVPQDSVYYLREGEAVPFDPDAGWQNGDTLPRRYLRDSSGSRADIRVVGDGRWADGYWDVTLRRAMDTGSPLDDKIFVDRGSYSVAFAIHRDATGGRWHYVSLPFTLGLGREAEIVAERFTGATPDWGDAWTEVTLFYPGQVSWPHLRSAQHAGADKIAAGVPVKFRHSEAQLAHYGVEAEFRDPIKRQWLLTMGAGLLLIGGFGVPLNRLIRRKQGA
jgi:hypothetical protein